jgi:short subunit dehydrogenase-like uncharacterized protein
MTYKILLYGATGHSGQTIAKLAAERGMVGNGACSVTLAARPSEELRALARFLGLGYCEFGLDDEAEIVKVIGPEGARGARTKGFDVVVNVAGPFALTAARLATAAIKAGCDYVDINGEVDVYMKLDDLAGQAASRGVRLVSSVGQTAAASNLMLDVALKELIRLGLPSPGSKTLGAIRIALSLPAQPSRGSAVTALRLVREQVLTLRWGKRRNEKGQFENEGLVKWHEPAGRLDRAFRFGGPGDPLRPRVATAANLVDTMAALQLAERGPWVVGSIESYLQMDLPARATFQFASTFAALNTWKRVADLNRFWAERLFPADAPVLKDDAQTVILEIDDPWRRRLVEWRLTTPPAYDFTAELVVKLMQEMCRVAAEARRASKGAAADWPTYKVGWLTPSEVLQSETVNDLKTWLEGGTLVQLGGLVPGPAYGDAEAHGKAQA